MLHDARKTRRTGMTMRILLPLNVFRSGVKLQSRRAATTIMKKPENTSNQTKERKTIKLSDFAVTRVKMWDNGGVSADLVLNGIEIYGVRVVEGKNGDFLSYPQRKGSDGKYYHIARAPLCEEDQRAVIAEIERKLNGGD